MKYWWFIVFVLIAGCVIGVICDGKEAKNTLDEGENEASSSPSPAPSKDPKKSKDSKSKRDGKINIMKMIAEQVVQQAGFDQSDFEDIEVEDEHGEKVHAKVFTVKSDDLDPDSVQQLFLKKGNKLVEGDDESETENAALDDAIEQEMSRPGYKEYEEAQALITELEPKIEDGSISTEDIEFERERILALLEKSKTLANDNALAQLGTLYLEGRVVTRNLTQAGLYFTEGARLGNSVAQYNLGFLHATGRGVPADPALALLYSAFSARAGNEEASMVMGYRSLYGIGITKSCTRALKYYQAVAMKTVSTIQKEGGMAPIQKKRLSAETKEVNKVQDKEHDIVNYYKLQAQQGDPNALATMGQLHFHGGYGVEQNRELARDYLERAAAQGNADAHADLGHMYSQGYGVKVDNETARKHYEAAAAQGNVNAYVGMGLMAMGNKDYVSAMKSFKKAADKNNAEGQINLGVIYLGGLGTPVDYKKAHHFFALAAQKGHTVARFHLAQMYQNGMGVPKDCKMAVKLYRGVSESGPWAAVIDVAYVMYKERNDAESALLFAEEGAHHGYEVAQHNAAWLFDQGIGTPPDEPMESPPASVDAEHVEEWFESATQKARTERYEKAMVYYRRCAAQHNVEATLRLGDMHYYALGLAEPDMSKAAQYYLDAAEKKNPQSMFNLGYMHEFGVGVTQDFHLAKRYYDMSSTTSPDAFMPATLARLGLAFHFLWSCPADILPTIMSSHEQLPAWVLPTIDMLRQHPLTSSLTSQIVFLSLLILALCIIVNIRFARAMLMGPAVAEANPNGRAVMMNGMPVVPPPHAHDEHEGRPD